MVRYIPAQSQDESETTTPNFYCAENESEHKENSRKRKSECISPSKKICKDVDSANSKTSGPIKEMDYCGMINRCLPEHIRVVRWTEVTPDFNARFSASFRTYRYFFVKRKLDVEAMNQAASLIVGVHDFRNMCKLDIANVSNFTREIYSARVIPFDNGKKIL